MSGREKPHRPGRYLVSIEVWDNETQRDICNDGFNTDSLAVVERALREAIVDAMLAARSAPTNSDPTTREDR